jgi:hypothetical protein
MSGYKINGNTLYAPDEGQGSQYWTAPSDHSVGPAQITIGSTIGGKIGIEPPSGLVRVHTWNYDGRFVEALSTLFGYIGTNPQCVIDTYDNDGTLLTNLVVLLQIPEIKSAGNRNLSSSFSLVWTEVRPQS